MSVPYFFVRLCLCFFVFFPHAADAHVKWFSAYNTSEEPLSLETIFQIDGFWPVMFISAAFIYFMVYVDAKTQLLNRYINVYRYQKIKGLPDDFFYRTLMLTLVVFISCIWAIGGIILTPELEHNSNFVSAIQVLMLASLMIKPTAKYAGYGIFVLWVYAVSKYGLFHLADYMIFLGIAFFMVKGADNTQNKVMSIAFLVLYIEISWTLQWASVEKWVYPNWSYPLLEAKPYLTMGFTKEIFMVMAGFVEFALAFLLIVLTGAGFVVTCVALASVFVLAIIDFGKVDAIGHLAIIVCLLLMAIKGPSGINLWFEKISANPATRATKVTALYFVSLMFFVAIYYGVQYVYNNYLSFH